MKIFVAVLVLAACLSAEGRTLNSFSSTVFLKDYFATPSTDSRIISGQLAKLGQFPHQVALILHHSNGVLTFCGGSLISTKWVLTAAHCVDGIVYWGVKIGGIRSDINEPYQYYATTKKGIVHPDYNEFANNDLGLIELEVPVILTENIKTIRLPSRSEVNDRLEDVICTVSGWGKNADSDPGAVANLNYVSLSTITNPQCIEVFGDKAVIDSTLCCQGNPKGSTCSGDSGGALTRIAADGLITQVGIVSYVSHYGCSLGFPSAYVRTASFLDWISENTGVVIRP